MGKVLNDLMSTSRTNSMVPVPDIDLEEEETVGPGERGYGAWWKREWGGFLENQPQRDDDKGSGPISTWTRHHSCNAWISLQYWS